MLNAGDRAPEIEAVDLIGGFQSLSQMLSDTSSPVLLAFFKVSCPTCQFTFPFLQRFADHGVRVIGIGQDPAAASDAFRERFQLRFPIWLDSASEQYPASNAYKITHVPSLFLVSAKGLIERAVSGFSQSDLEELGKRSGFEVFSADEAVPAFRPG